MVDNKGQETGPDPGLSPRNGAEKMHRLLLAGLIVLTGCTSLTGPRKRAINPPERADVPGLSIREQEYRGRDQLSYPDIGRAVGPRTWAEVPADQYGRLSH